MKTQLFLLWLSLSALVESPSLGDGKLPAGDIKALDQSQDKVSSPKQLKTSTCFDTFLSLPHYAFLNDQDDGAIYFLAQTSSLKKTKNWRLYQHKLFSIDTRFLKGDAVLSLKQGSRPYLLGMGNPLTAISTLSFMGRGKGCARGRAGLISIALRGSKTRALKAKPEVQILQGGEGFFLFSKAKRGIIKQDSFTFQTRVIKTIPEGEIPLFYDPKTDSHVTFQEEKPRGLKRYFGLKTTPSKKWAIKPEEMIVQERDLFASVTFDLDRSQVTLFEIPHWSGVTQLATYKLDLPKELIGKSLGIDVLFDRKWLLLYGQSYFDRKEIGKIYLVAYDTGKVLKTISPLSKDGFLDSLHINKAKGFLLIEEKDKGTNTFSSLQLLRLTDLALKPVKIEI
jgi:hypothetical protein